MPEDINTRHQTQSGNDEKQVKTIRVGTVIKTGEAKTTGMGRDRT